MNLYKQATRENWTFPSSKGNLTVHQLWSLSLTNLDVVATNLYEMTPQAGKSFIKAKNATNILEESKLDLVKDIIATKEAEAEEKQSAKVAESHNKMIDALIEQKQTEKLGSLSIEQLMALKK